MKLRASLRLVILLLGIAGPLIAGPPCKTPEELRASVETCLKTRDANQFWKLHSWVNVSPKEEKLHKDVSVGIFGQANEPRPKFTVTIVPAPEGINTPKRLKNGGQMKHNIPVIGLIAYTEESARLSNENAVTFGKGADGNYWLTVEIVVLGTNKPPVVPPPAPPQPAVPRK